MAVSAARRRLSTFAVVTKFAVIAGLCVVAGCAAPPPPPPPPTIVNLTLTTLADVNPNASGQGAPVVVRVFQLGSAAGFEKAEFFRLLNQDTATLGADVIKRDEYLLAPGTTKMVTLEPTAPVKAIGVFAAYRNFATTTWRSVADVPEHKTTDVTVTADAQGITVVSKPAPAPAKPGS